ncbi:MAG: sugar phosphate isomerase/epimerase [Candidatus Saccharimonadales bacterium]
MNLAVSSIAWQPEEETEIAKTLQRLGVKNVELAPTKIWDDPTKASVEDAQHVVEWWKGYDIEVVAFQSMLFARPDLKLFESEQNRAECLQYLKDFVVLAGRMGARKMVFGSPKNRQRGDMSYEDAFSIATVFFGELAITANENNVVFCIEPNAPQYNCDFVTTAKEGAELVRAVNHPGFGLHLDTACMALAGDDIAEYIKESSDILQHFHVSSPMLEQVEVRDDVDHVGAATALNEIGYCNITSIEMRPGDVGTNVARIEQAVRFVQSTYGS